MNRIFLLIFILHTCTFAQENISNNPTDTLQTNKSDFDVLIGINLMYSNYTLGVEEDAHKGKSFGLNFDYRLVHHKNSEYTLRIGSLIINQKGGTSCEHEEKIRNNYTQPVFYLKAENSSFYKHFMYKIGVAFNTACEENQVCRNEIYFHPILLTYDIGIGEIDVFYFNFGLNTDFEINKSYGKNYGLFNTGLNYIFNARDYIRINYYWNRDNFNHNRFYHGWILKSHQRIYNRYGININFYYSNDIKGFSLNLGLTYAFKQSDE